MAGEVVSVVRRFTHDPCALVQEAKLSGDSEVHTSVVL